MRNLTLKSGILCVLQHKLKILGFVFLTALFLMAAPQTSQARCDCDKCPSWDCERAARMVQEHHRRTRREVYKHLRDEMNAHRDWLVEDFFKQEILPAMQKMTAQLSTVGAYQTFIIGTFFDAEQQLETQRLFQELQTEAHRDYQPSQDFCYFGTGVRSMGPTEERGKFNAKALNAIQMGRQLGNVNFAGASKEDSDKASRWEAFTSKYCDPQDNNWVPDSPGTGLSLICNAPATSDRINIDVDFTRLIEDRRTLDVAFTDQGAATQDEEDVLALSNNLYAHDVLSRQINREYLRSGQYQYLYLALRSVAAKRNVAQSSFNAIVGLKSAGSSDLEGLSEPKTREFLAAIVKELGVSDPAQVYELIGKNPSYYAQLELLAKKIYQNPDFYANLYDKPANVARKGVALKAIDLMLDRAIYESQLRQEMAMSVLLSSKLRPLFNSVNEDLSTATRN